MIGSTARTPRDRATADARGRCATTISVHCLRAEQDFLQRRAESASRCSRTDRSCKTHAQRVRRQLAHWYAALAEAESTNSQATGVRHLRQSVRNGIHLPQQLRAGAFTVFPGRLLEAERARRALCRQDEI